jgi:hypothetical protein
MNIYYVYAYLNEDGTPYYIGKGKEDRAYAWHDNVPLPKNKSNIVLLQDNLNEKDAYDIERYYIQRYGCKAKGGILMNIYGSGKIGETKTLTMAPLRDHDRYVHYKSSKYFNSPIPAIANPGPNDKSLI